MIGKIKKIIIWCTRVKLLYYHSCLKGESSEVLMAVDLLRRSGEKLTRLAGVDMTLTNP